MNDFEVYLTLALLFGISAKQESGWFRIVGNVISIGYGIAAGWAVVR